MKTRTAIFVFLSILPFLNSARADSAPLGSQAPDWRVLVSCQNGSFVVRERVNPPSRGSREELEVIIRNFPNATYLLNKGAVDRIDRTAAGAFQIMLRNVTRVIPSGKSDIQFAGISKYYRSGHPYAWVQFSVTSPVNGRYKIEFNDGRPDSLPGPSRGVLGYQDCRTAFPTYARWRSR